MSERIEQKMELEQIKQLDGQVITLDELLEVEESEHVISVDNNGLSGLHYEKHWFSVYLVDDDEIQVYF